MTKRGRSKSPSPLPGGSLSLLSDTEETSSFLSAGEQKKKDLLPSSTLPASSPPLILKPPVHKFYHHATTQDEPELLSNFELQKMDVGPLLGSAFVPPKTHIRSAGIGDGPPQQTVNKRTARDKDRQFESLISEMNSLKVGLKYNSNSRRFTFEFDENTCMRIVSPALCYLLGFNSPQESILMVDTRTAEEKKRRKKPSCTTPFAPDFDHFIQHMFVYSNVCEWSMIGTMTSPVLGVVNITPALQAGDTNSTWLFEFSCPKYIAVTKNMINEISIRLADHSGKAYGFDHGRVTVGLHFRKKQC